MYVTVFTCFLTHDILRDLRQSLSRVQQIFSVDMMSLCGSTFHWGWANTLYDESICFSIVQSSGSEEEEAEEEPPAKKKKKKSR